MAKGLREQNANSVATIRSVRVLSLRTVKSVAVAKIQLRVVQNVRDVGGESKALVVGQGHFATIRLQAAD